MNRLSNFTQSPYVQNAVSGCKQIFGAAAIGVIVGPAVARYCFFFSYLNNQNSFKTKEGYLSASDYTLKIPYISAILPTELKQTESEIVGYKKIYTIIPIIKKLASPYLTYQKDISIFDIDMAGVLVGSISQVALLVLSHVAKRYPKMAGCFGTIAVFIAYSCANKKETSDMLSEGQQDVLLLATVTTCVTTALLQLSAIVPRNMHLRTFGIVD